MTRAMICLAAAALAAAPALGQGPTPEETVRKAIEAHGGAATLNKYPAGTADIKGVITVQGLEIPFSGKLAYSAPGKNRTEIATEFMGAKTTLLQIVKGQDVKQIENGRPATLSAAMKEELLQTPALQEMSLLTPLLDAKRYALAPEKGIDVNGAATTALAVKAKGLRDVKLFFDAKTGLLLRMQRRALDPTAKEVVETNDFSDYKKVSGMMVPMKSVVEHDGKTFMTATVSDYKALEKVDDQLFTVAD